MFLAITCWIFYFSDNIAEPAKALRDEFNAKLFVVAVGNDNDENKLIVGNGNENHILNFDQWRGIGSSDIGPLADVICKVSYTFAKISYL